MRSRRMNGSRFRRRGCPMIRVRRTPAPSVVARPGSVCTTRLGERTTAAGADEAVVLRHPRSVVAATAAEETRISRRLRAARKDGTKRE
jgi:hypothetical protein